MKKVSPQIQEQLDTIFLDTWDLMHLAESYEECDEILKKGQQQVDALLEEKQIKNPDAPHTGIIT